ncbi:MAG: redoxin domain-containing protein [Chitinophagaceae bacterium]|nr:redoxin domain-containing protein [Chitinophagaceae bacterium]
MTRLCFISIAILLSFSSESQSGKNRVVTDNGRKFQYSDSAGVTQSYISYFSDSLPVPDLVTLDGKRITKSDIQGKTVVYNFWFVACRPCVAEIPALNQLAKKYQSDSTLFLALTFDDESRINGFLQNHAFDFQIVSLSETEIDKIKRYHFIPLPLLLQGKGKFLSPCLAGPQARIPKLKSSTCLISKSGRPCRLCVTKCAYKFVKPFDHEKISISPALPDMCCRQFCPDRS